MKVYLDQGAFPPVRAHSTDAGLDLCAKDRKDIPPHGSATFHTGVHIELPAGTAGILISKSGLNVMHDITSTGLIDQGYGGEVVVKLHNHGNTWYTVHAGDKISQLVVVPVLYEPVELVEEPVAGGERASNGFGSTGR